MTGQNYPDHQLDSFERFSESSKKTSCAKSDSIVFIFLFFLLVSVLLPLPVSAQINNQINTTNADNANNIENSDHSDWIGSYYFSEIAPIPKRRRARDVRPSASYDITIEKASEKNKENADQLIASFSANGVQLFEAYQCAVVVKDDKLDFYFEKTGLPEVENFRKFKQGDLLFSLSKIQTGKTVRYLFQPVAYKIIRLSPAKQKQPVYFEKP